MKNISLFLIACISLFAGCRTSSQFSPVGSDSQISEELEIVQEEFQEIESREDKLKIYKLFAGAGDYLSVCEDLSDTSQFDGLLAKVQKSYGWEREKYPEFTDAVSDYLISVDYDEPQLLDSSRKRRAFAKIFLDLAEVTKYE